MRDGTFRNPRTAYRRLFTAAGVDEPGLEALVRREGIEGALAELRDRGVAVTYEEFKAVSAGDPAYAEKFGQGANFRKPRAGSLTMTSGTSRSAGTAHPATSPYAGVNRSPAGCGHSRRAERSRPRGSRHRRYSPVFGMGARELSRQDARRARM